MKISDNTKNSFVQFLGFFLRDVSESILTNLFNKIEDDDEFPGFDDDDDDLF